ncbi:hypothetical protein J2T13_002832 [Paenibacillus sp. DS2015]
MLKKPKIPAMTAMIKRITDHLNIIVHLTFLNL